jgi:hypothetical protein
LRRILSDVMTTMTPERHASLTALSLPRSKRTANHRETGRHVPARRAAALTFRGKSVVARLVNQAPGGIAVFIDLVPRIGEEVIVTLGDGTRLPAWFCWYRAGVAGIRFS